MRNPLHIVEVRESLRHGEEDHGKELSHHVRGFEGNPTFSLPPDDVVNFEDVLPEDVIDFPE